MRKWPREVDRRGVTTIPIPPANYLIGFIEDTISSEGEQAIAASVGDFDDRAGSSEISQAIVGVAYADAAGFAVAEVQLSQRRAIVVAAALVALGVPPGKVTINWNGEPGSANYPCNEGDAQASPPYGSAKICVTGGQLFSRHSGDSGSYWTSFQRWMMSTLFNKAPTK